MSSPSSEKHMLATCSQAVAISDLPFDPFHEYENVSRLLCLLYRRIKAILLHKSA